MSAPETATPANTATRDALDRAFVHGLAWSAVGRWISQVFRWAATVATAKLLLPDDYGIVGLAMLIVGFLQYFAEFGFGAAIVQQRTLPHSTVRQIGGASVMISLGLSVVMIASAPFAARFYDQPALRLVLPVMTIRLLIDAFAVVPRSVLARDLQFKKLSALEGVESLLMAAVTVGTAWITRSYWSFIIGNLASGLVFATAATIVARAGPALPRAFAEIRSHVAFGFNIVISRISWYAYTNADFAVVGKVMDSTILGLYSFAWNIASVPAEKLSGLVLGVAPSVLAAARTNPAEMRRYYLLLVRGVALVTFPIAVGLALVSPDLIHAVFGAKWEGAIAPLRFLALFFGVRSIATLAPVVMIANGEPKVDRNFSLTFLVILPPLFLVGSRWGIAGVAATWLVAYPVLFGLMGQRWVLNRLNVPVRVFLSEILPALAGVAVMALAVAFVSTLTSAWPAALRLLFLTALGAMVYVGVVHTFFRDVFHAALGVVRNSPAL